MVIEHNFMDLFVEFVIFIDQSNSIIDIVLSFLDKLVLLHVFNILVDLMHLNLGYAHWIRIFAVKVRNDLCATLATLIVSFWYALHWTFRRTSDWAANRAVQIACLARDEPASTLAALWHDARGLVHSDDAWAFVTLAYKVSILDINNGLIKHLARIHHASFVFRIVSTSVDTLVAAVLLYLIFYEHPLILACVFKIAETPRFVLVVMMRRLDLLRFLPVQVQNTTFVASFNRPDCILLFTYIIWHLPHFAMHTNLATHPTTIQWLSSTMHHDIHIILHAHHLTSLHMDLLFKHCIYSHYSDLLVFQLLVLV